MMSSLLDEKGFTMRVSREQATRNRERVLEVAAQLFRERGFDGIGVADLMKGAGLTHGGFYGQFGSKEDLMAQACERAFGTSLQRWEELAAAADDPAAGLAAMVREYLSMSHRDRPGSGCAITALGAEAPRQGPALRAAFSDGVNGLFALLTRLVKGRSEARRRERAILAFSAMVGAQVLARAVDDALLSAEILETVQAGLLDEQPA